MAPFLGATGLNTTLHDTAFCHHPGVVRVRGQRPTGSAATAADTGCPTSRSSGHNAVQGSFRFSG